MQGTKRGESQPARAATPGMALWRRIVEWMATVPPDSRTVRGGLRRALWLSAWATMLFVVATTVLYLVWGEAYLP